MHNERPVAREHFPNGWGAAEAAAIRLRREDGTRAVLAIEPDSRRRGLLSDPLASGSYSGATRKILLESNTWGQREFDTVLHECAHAMLHYDVSEQHYMENLWWIESEADVVTDLVRQILGGSPRASTQLTLRCLGNEDDQAAFFHFAAETLIPAAEAIAAAFRKFPPQQQFEYVYACLPTMKLIQQPSLH